MSDTPVCIHVSTSDRGGGAEHAALSLHRAMARWGWSSTLAVGWQHDDVEGCVQIPNERYSSMRTRLARKWRVSRGYEIAPYPGTVHIPQLSPRTPDVIHLHNLHGHYFDLRELPRLSAQYPTVLTVHDGWLLSGHCAHGVECERWMSGCGQCPHLEYPPRIPHDKTMQNWKAKRRIVQKSALHVVAPSQWMAKRFESAFGPHLASLQVIPNGVDPQVFRPRDRDSARTRFGIDSDAFVIGTNHVGANNPYKDLEGTRQAIVQEIDKHSNQKTVVLCIGDATVPDLPPPVRLLSTGYLSQSDVAWALNCCDLFVHISRVENLPLAPIEAQMCGVPIKVNEVGGLPETLSDSPRHDFDINYITRQYLALYDKVRNNA